MTKKKNNNNNNKNSPLTARFYHPRGPARKTVERKNVRLSIRDEVKKKK
jgi:hypothetical protein